MNWIKRAFRSISYVWLMYPRGKSGTDMGDSDEHRRKRACIE